MTIVAMGMSGLANRGAAQALADVGPSEHSVIGMHSVMFASIAPTDMRKSFAVLVGLVEKELGQQVETGGLFLFVSRRRNAVKVRSFSDGGHESFI